MEVKSGEQTRPAFSSLLARFFFFFFDSTRSPARSVPTRDSQFGWPGLARTFLPAVASSPGIASFLCARQPLPG
jgi:hypothetical protein